MINKLPEFHFDDGYEAKLECSEDSHKEWAEMMEKLTEDEEYVFDRFEDDLISCLNNNCCACHYYKDTGECDIDQLEENIHRMVDNQRRMYMAFKKQRGEKNDGE